MFSTRFLFSLWLVFATSQLLHASNDFDFDNENEELQAEEEDQLDYSKVKVTVLHRPDTCEKKAKTNDFLTLHFTSRWVDGPIILTT